MSAVQFTADPTSATDLEAVIAAAQAMLVRLLPPSEKASVGPETTVASTPISEELAERTVKALMPRLGKKLTTMLVADATLSTSGEYTVKDLAERLGVGPKTIRSHRGNLGRSLARIRRKVDGTPESIWTWRYDDSIGGYQFQMIEPMRKAVLKHMKPTI